MSHILLGDREPLSIVDAAPGKPTSARSNSAYYDIDASHASGLVRATIRGFWPMEVAVAYVDEMAGILAVARRRGSARLIVDLTGAAIQSPEVMQKLGVLDMYAPEDRVAVIVASSLLKTQLKRVFVKANLAVFVSEEAAETWVFVPV